MTQVHRRCEKCGEVTFTGEKLTRTLPDGEVVDDGYEGNFVEGAGICEECDRELCGGCAQWDEDGVCDECRGEPA
jgi:hypothetical protein